MSEVIKRWVACKTGVEPDLEPRALRRLLADGTLLARLLHSYFVVDAALREQVRATDDPELRRKNWAVLRRWLLLVGLELADDVINEIAEARGSTAGLLLYQLFLRLECLGKEQAMSQAGPVPRARKNSRFEVLPTVDVVPPAEQTFDHVATRPTRPAQWGAVGEWYTQRYAAALAHVNAGRQDFRRAVEARLRSGSPASPPRGADAAHARLPPCMPPETVADGQRQVGMRMKQSIFFSPTPFFLLPTQRPPACSRACPKSPSWTGSASHPASRRRQTKESPKG